MDEQSDSLHEALRALEVMFLKKLPGKMQEIESALAQFVEKPDDKDHAFTLYRLLHTLAGSAGTFGFASLGEHSRELEIRMKPFVNGESWEPAMRQEFTDAVAKFIQDALVDAKK